MYKSTFEKISINYGKPLVEITESLPCIIVSDLHLGSGKNNSGNYKSHENFFYDSDFAEFLDHYGNTDKHHLIINGDFIDFVRIVDLPVSNDDFIFWKSELAKIDLVYDESFLRKSINKREKKFGLKTHHYKSVWKLAKSINGHSVFFQAIAKQLIKGWKLTWTKGNHDLELYWEEIRKYFILRLAEFAHEIEPAKTTEDYILQFSEQILFIDDKLKINNKVLIEHGHKFDKVSTVNGSAVLKNQEEINYPVGTFFNRYLINKLESSYPYLDNIRPIGNVFSKVFKDDTLAGLKLLFYHIPLSLRLLTKGNLVHFVRPLLASILVFLVPFIVLAYQLFFKLTEWTEDLSKDWKNIVFAVTILILWSVLSMVFMKIFARFNIEEAGYFTKEAEKVLENDRNIELFSVGHSHNPQQLKVEDQYFFNTGTWIPILEWDSTDIRMEKMFSFVYLDFKNDGSIFKEFRRWDPNRKEKRELILVENIRLKE